MKSAEFTRMSGNKYTHNLHLRFAIANYEKIMQLRIMKKVTF